MRGCALPESHRSNDRSHRAPVLRAAVATTRLQPNTACASVRATDAIRLAVQPAQHANTAAACVPCVAQRDAAEAKRPNPSRAGFSVRAASVGVGWWQNANARARDSTWRSCRRRHSCTARHDRCTARAPSTLERRLPPARVQTVGTAAGKTAAPNRIAVSVETTPPKTALDHGTIRDRRQLGGVHRRFCIVVVLLEHSKDRAQRDCRRGGCVDARRACGQLRHQTPITRVACARVI